MTDQVKIGNVTVTAMADFTPPAFPTAQFFPDVPEDAWRPYRRWLNPQGQFQTNFCFFALRSPGGLVLVDTGLGPGPHEMIGGARGRLLEWFQIKGFSVDQVQAVVITHLHLDHMGWNVTMEGETPRPTFPNAKYYLPKGDWDHFTKPEILENNPAVRGSAMPLQDLGVLELVEGDYAVTPEITTVATPGHTPGHLSVLISSQGEQAMVLGDVMHSPAQITELEWCAGADLDKETSRKSRRSVVERAERDGVVLAVGHFLMEKNIGKVITREGRRMWQVL